MSETKRSQYIYLILHLLVFVCLCQGCTKSTLKYSWSDNTYEGTVKEPILVIGVFKEPTAHKIYEDSFVAEFQKAGVVALPSYKYDLGTSQPSMEKLQQIVKQAGASTVLITHLLNEKSSSYQFPEKGYVYAGGMTWDEVSGYHSAIYAAVWGGNKSVDKTVDRMEAVLFDGKSGKHIWSARSKSVNLNKMLRIDDAQLEELFIKDLKAHKLL